MNSALAFVREPPAVAASVAAFDFSRTRLPLPSLGCSLQRDLQLIVKFFFLAAAAFGRTQWA